MKILFGSAYPCGNLRVLVIALLALAQRRAVLFRVEKKLRLPDNAVRPAKPVHHVREVKYLFDTEWRQSLLSVAESGISYPYVFRRRHGNDAVIERYFRYIRIRKYIPEEVRFRNILQFITIFIRLKRATVFVKTQHNSSSKGTYFVG